MINEPIERAIAVVGTQKKLAERVGVAQPTVWSWLHSKKKVSPEYVPVLVAVTGGAVSAAEIRPDLPDVFPPNADSGNPTPLHTKP